MFSSIGMPEILVIIVAVLVLFGAKKIPEFMRGLGKGIREFKDASTNVRNEIEQGASEPSPNGQAKKSEEKTEKTA